LHRGRPLRRRRAGCCRPSGAAAHLRDATPGEIHARAFVLVDGSGATIARLAEVGEKGPLLAFTAKRARAQVLVGALGDDTGVGLVADDGTSAHLAVGGAAGPALSIHGQGRAR
jgi:hypothetical protein